MIFTLREGPCREYVPEVLPQECTVAGQGWPVSIPSCRLRVRSYSSKTNLTLHCAFETCSPQYISCISYLAFILHIENSLILASLLLRPKISFFREFPFCFSCLLSFYFIYLTHFSICVKNKGKWLHKYYWDESASIPALCVNCCLQNSLWMLQTIAMKY